DGLNETVTYITGADTHHQRQRTATASPIQDLWGNIRKKENPRNCGEKTSNFFATFLIGKNAILPLHNRRRDFDLTTKASQ
ncbi:hypothetical protein, partial [Escherichia coli]|uniref:hypothetical protein n=1 Tax=Escherichia coli TaxID=562 RepID=UPI0005118A82